MYAGLWYRYTVFKSSLPFLTVIPLCDVHNAHTSPELVVHCLLDANDAWPHLGEPISVDAGSGTGIRHHDIPVSLPRGLVTGRPWTCTGG